MIGKQDSDSPTKSPGRKTKFDKYREAMAPEDFAKWDQ